MVNRVLIGDHPTFGMGGFVSQLGVDVWTANKFQLSWSSSWESLQIVSSGSVSIPGDSSFSATFSWTDLGYYPVILASFSPKRFLLQYLSTNSARIRNDPDNFSTSAGTCYYVVTKTVRP